MSVRTLAIYPLFVCCCLSVARAGARPATVTSEPPNRVQSAVRAETIPPSLTACSAEFCLSNAAACCLQNNEKAAGLRTGLRYQTA